MKKLRTLKDIETPDHSIPRVMTPEDGDEETRILAERYILHVNSWSLRKLIIDWILDLRQPEKERKRTLEKSNREWLKEEHEDDGYNSYAILLYSLPTWHKEERAQVKILKKIFGITEKEIKEHGK